jgi:hypothetical protein
LLALGEEEPGAVEANIEAEKKNASRRIKIFFMRKQFWIMNFAQRSMKKNKIFGVNGKSIQLHIKLAIVS